MPLCGDDVALTDVLSKDLGHMPDPYVMARMTTPETLRQPCHSVRVPPASTTWKGVRMKPPEQMLAWMSTEPCETARTVTKKLPYPALGVSQPGIGHIHERGRAAARIRHLRSMGGIATRHFCHRRHRMRKAMHCHTRGAHKERCLGDTG